MSRLGTIKYLLAVLMVAVCSVPARASGETPYGVMPNEGQLYTLLSEANSTFRQANELAGDQSKAKQLYTRAILLYEKIIDQGKVRNAKLYYNLANAYFLNDDLGRAILNYRRAQALDSSDLNIRNNLAFARSQRLDKVAVETRKRVLETLFFWHYDFSVQTRFLLACVFFALFCLVVTLMIWLGRGPATSTSAIVLGVLLLCLVASVAIETIGRAHTVNGVITAEQIVARQGDGPNYSPSFKDPLHAGTEFQLVERRPGWFHIVLSDGSDAWIPDETADLV